MSNPTTPEKKPSPLARTPPVCGAFPLDTQGLLNHTDPKPMSSSSLFGKAPAAPAKAPQQVQTSSGDRISGTIPKIEPKLIGQDNYMEWINKLEMTLFLYKLT